MNEVPISGVLPAFPPERENPALAEARVGVMITAFRIGPVLTDTILSALEQRHVRPVAVLLVIDGCPETRTTRAIAERYLAAYPGLIHVLWLRNGGVSRARNRGLQWLMDRHPDLEAIYCLDGDDLISTTSVASGLLALRDAQARHPGRRFGWVVANKLNFGDDHNYVETPEGFRRTSYLSVNLSQPSCLYNAEMFREGLRWDETMRSGIEDWEFWLEAIRGDFEGVFNPRDLLYYRRLMGNRSSVNRRNDSYNIPYMRQKHAALYTPQAVLAEEQAVAPRFAFARPGGREFEMLSDPGAPGRRLSLHAARNALAARLQRQAPEDYIYDPYAPDRFVVIDAPLRGALERQGLLRGLLSTADALLSEDAAIVEVMIGPMTQDQREVSARGDAWIVPAGAPPCDTAGRRSVIVVRPGRLAGAAHEPAELLPLTRRLMLHSDSLPPAAERGTRWQELLPMIEQLTCSDPDGAEASLGRAQARAGRFYVSSRRIARHAALTERAIGTGPLFPQLSTDGASRAAVILPPAGLTPNARELLGKLAADPRTARRISLFAPGHHLPRPEGRAGAAVENVSSLAGWLDTANVELTGHSVGVPCWESAPEALLTRLAGLFAPFDEVFCFDLQMFAPVMLKLRGLGVTTVCCEAEPAAGVQDDPVAALTYAGAYARIVCTTQARADLLSGLGYPLSRIDIGFGQHLQTTLPLSIAAAE